MIPSQPSFLTLPRIFLVSLGIFGIAPFLIVPYYHLHRLFDLGSRGNLLYPSLFFAVVLSFACFFLWYLFSLVLGA